MRLVLDTNILISALLSEQSLPAQILAHWRKGQFTLLCCDEQIEELRRVTRYPKIRERLPSALAGRLINELHGLAAMIDRLPEVDVSRDRWDNYLLALAEAGDAQFLVTGVKADLLSLDRRGKTRIVTARQVLGHLPD